MKHHLVYTKHLVLMKEFMMYQLPMQEVKIQRNFQLDMKKYNKKLKEIVLLEL